MYRFAYAAEEKPVKQGKWYYLLLAAVIIAAFIVQAISLWESSGEKEAEEIVHAAEKLILAANTNKSIFLPGEDAGIAIAVLDEKGNMVCNADVTLAITSPSGDTTIFSTSDGGIKVSPECTTYGVTVLPDYYTTYRSGSDGTYTMNLTAITPNGISSITDNFTVQPSVAFDVARNAPTRIYPVISHNMTISIKASRDYKGAITEQVPSDFEISSQKGLNVTSEGITKILTWETEMKAGRRYTFSYEFRAPEASPALYELGPFRIGNWSEARRWQIASDIFAAGENEVTFLRAQGCMLEAATTAAQRFSSLCAGTYPGNCPTDRLSCNDATFESASPGNNRWAGVNITSFNSTITDCASVTSVRLCHNWTINTASTYGNCRVGTDVAGDGTYNTTTVACPTTTSNALVCTDVTSSEVSWTCQHFFGIAAPAAWAMIEAQRTQSGAGHTIRFDVLYFNVTYTPNVPPNNTIIFPAGGNFSGRFLVNASVNSSTGTVVKVNLTISNNTGNATWLIPMSLGAGTATTGWWNATFDSTALPDGFYNLSVNATNSAGLTNISQNITIRIDNTKANVTAIVPLNKSNLTGSILINASINDSGSAVFNATFRLMNRTYATAWLFATRGAGTISIGWWNTTFNSFQLADGRYNITLNATDFAGNQQLLNISEINIDNGGPIIRNVSMLNSIYLVPGDVSFVECNATVEDDNGPDYIYLVNATFYDSAKSFNSANDRNDHYENVSCSIIAGQASNNQQNYTCGFNVYYYANNATWVCNVTATSSVTFNRTNSSVNLTLVNELLAIAVNKSEIDYGNITVMGTSLEHAVNVSNFGNVPINVSVKGFGWDNETCGENWAMMCEGNNISIGYERFSNVSGMEWQYMTNLSSSFKPVNITLWQKQDDNNPGNDTNSTYWRLRVPLGIFGLCNGTITFAGVLG
ncbi:MAG: Ig-like domain-containing protein [Candidatus Woesearchaeota archaeon]